MAENSKIEWTDHTFNPWRGCTKIAPGCANCYAAREAKRFPKIRGVWGESGKRVMAAHWRDPLKWNKQTAVAHERYEEYCIAGGGVGVWNGPEPRRARVFCASLADIFEDWQGDIHDHNDHRLWVDRNGSGAFIPETPQGSFANCRPVLMDDLRKRLFLLIDSTPWLDWQIVTKRPENIQRMWPSVTGTEHYDIPDSFRDNVWLLTSVSEQETADRNIDELLECRELAPVLGVSYEPALGPVDFGLPWIRHADGSIEKTSAIDWVIVGGESGPGARPFDLSWAQSTVSQCKAAGVPVFVKQLGANAKAWDQYADGLGGITGGGGTIRYGTEDRKGGDPSEWPEDLRVREFPKAAVGV